MTHLNLAKELISIPSTKDNPQAFGEIESLIKDSLNGYLVKSYSSKGVPSWLASNKNTTEFKVVLNGHLDVVPGKTDQFKPRIEGDKLMGRGAYDMKAACAVLIEAFKQVVDQVDYPLGLQLVCDEEVGGFDGTKHQVDKGVKTEFVLSGEPTNLNIINQAKGLIWFKLVCEGKGAHGAYPWLGENAFWKMKQVLDKLEKRFPVPSKETFSTTVNLSNINTNSPTYNKVPEYCEAWFDIRYTPDMKDKIMEEVKALIPDDFQIDIFLDEPSYEAPKDNQILSQLQSSLEKNKIKSKLLKTHGNSDVRFYTPQGSNGIEFGPVGAGHHTDTEWVSIKSLEQYSQTLTDWLISLSRSN